jgi:hypothetical protein
VSDQESLFEYDGVQSKPPPKIWNVDGKRVTRAEARLAEKVLAAYNEVSGQSKHSRMWLAKIVMRIREHPDLTAEDHEGIIRRNFAAPWWRRAPSPGVIYGNEAVFESAMDATGEQKPRTRAEIKSDRIRKLSGG